MKYSRRKYEYSIVGSENRWWSVTPEGVRLQSEECVIVLRKASRKLRKIILNLGIDITCFEIFGWDGKNRKLANYMEKILDLKTE